MPRAPGQIDERKLNAILDAARETFAARGPAATLDEVARRAGVSKQTIYNRFGSKDELIRAMVERRRNSMLAVLDEPGAEDRLEETLAGYARKLLDIQADTTNTEMMRLLIGSVAERPELARIVYETGPKASLAGLAAFLEREAAAGRLAFEDARQAAEMFVGMAAGNRLMGRLLGGEPPPAPAEIDARARAAARRFVRAFAP